MANCDQSCADLKLDNGSQLNACIDGCTQVDNGPQVLPISMQIQDPVAVSQAKLDSPPIDVVQDPVPALGSDEDKASSSEEGSDAYRVFDLSSILGSLMRPSIMIHGEPVAVETSSKDAQVVSARCVHRMSVG